MNYSYVFLTLLGCSFFPALGKPALMDETKPYPGPFPNYTLVTTTGKVVIRASYFSPSRNYRLDVLNNDTILVRTCDNHTMFSMAYLPTTNDTKLILQLDNHLVFYRSQSETMENAGWDSQTFGPRYGPAELRLYDDGHLYLCSETLGCFWMSAGPLTSECEPALTGRPPNKSGARFTVIVGPNEWAATPFVKRSPSGGFELRFEEAGYLEVWRGCDYRRTSTTFAGPRLSGSGILEMHNDGRLEVELTAVENQTVALPRNITVASGPQGSELRLYNDGFLRICSPANKVCSWQSAGFLDAPEPSQDECNF